MKKIKLNLIIPVVVVFLTTMISSCDDDLERFPYDSIVTEQAFETFADAQKWNNSFSAAFRGRVSGYGFVHRWDGFLAADGGIAAVWQNYYSGIRDINVALAGFETFEFEDPDQVASLNVFRGNAYFARAYYYFQLVNRYAKPYNPSTVY